MFFVPLHNQPRSAANAFSRPALRQWNRVLDDALASLFASPAGADDAPARAPALDVAETDTAYTVTLEVPGVKRADLKVTVEDRRVSIKAFAADAAASPAAAPAATTAAAQGKAATGAEPASVDAAAPATTPGDRTVYRERLAARYERSFTLPVELDSARASAKLEDGVLVLELPKRTPVAASHITIN